MIAAGVLYIADGRILFLKRAANSENGGLWAFPAGHIEEGETPEQAAAREFMEETGHAAQNLSLISESIKFTLFLCRGEQFNPSLNHEHDGYVWASPDDLPQPLHPGITETLQGFAMDESARMPDINGWVEIKGNPLSKVGVYPYRGISIPGAADTNKVYQVYRPEEELADAECIASFRLLPWIDNHTMLGSEEDGLTPAEKKGVQGVIGEDVYFSEGTLFGNLKVFSQSLADLIAAGKRELSCGYRCVYEWVSGEFNGQPYDVIQRKIRGNHLALVEAGRMGPEVAVLDGMATDHFVFQLDAKEPPMADEENKATEEKTAMTLEEAAAAISQIMPVISKIQEMVAGAGTQEKSEAEALDEEKDDEKNGDEKSEEKKGEGMDEAVQFKSIVARVAARDRLAQQLSAHVGTFDHAEMTEQDVAEYGVQKLGISSPKGAELAVLTGYLQAKKDPRTEPVAKAMDSANADNFVTRHLNKGA